MNSSVAFAIPSTPSSIENFIPIDNPAVIVFSYLNVSVKAFDKVKVFTTSLLKLFVKLVFTGTVVPAIGVISVHTGSVAVKQVGKPY